MAGGRHDALRTKDTCIQTSCWQCQTNKNKDEHERADLLVVVEVEVTPYAGDSSMILIHLEAQQDHVTNSISSLHYVVDAFTAVLRYFLIIK